MICIFSVVHDTAGAGGKIQLHASALGTYEIDGVGEPGREKRDYSVCMIPDVITDKIYIGQDAPDGQFYRFDQLPGREFAEAIVASVQLGGGGIAVAAGPEPTPEEVASARERYLVWLDTLLRIGQEEWAQSRNPGRIPYFSRVAAQVLGVTAEWATAITGTARKRCDNCDTLVSVKAAWCPTCEFIFDMERAVAGGHLPAIQAQKELLAAAALLEEREAAEAAASAPAGAGKSRR